MSKKEDKEGKGMGGAYSLSSSLSGERPAPGTRPLACASVVVGAAADTRIARAIEERARLVLAATAAVALARGLSRVDCVSSLVRGRLDSEA